MNPQEEQGNPGNPSKMDKMGDSVKQQAIEFAGKIVA
jgi:hypothetical protein